MNQKPLPTRITTPEFVASFPHILKARENELNGETEFSINMLFDPAVDLSAMKTACANAAKNKWGDQVPAGLRSPFRKGDEKDYTGYKGKIFVTAKSKERPGVVDEDVQPVIDESLIYSGVVCRATVNAYAYDKKGNKGVSFFLCNVQRIRDGKKIGGGKAASEEFQPVPKVKQEPVDADAFMNDDDFARHVKTDSPEGVPF
jgi:hypothetical protein